MGRISNRDRAERASSTRFYARQEASGCRTRFKHRNEGWSRGRPLGVRARSRTRVLCDETLALAIRSLGILVLHCRDCDHLAVIPFTAQPTKKGAFK
jgi:hypothetical protein